MDYYLYQYTHRKSGKGYIGVTKNLKQRRRDHTICRSGARAFNNAVKKYGINAFDFRVLAIFDDNTEAARIEQTAIKAFETQKPNGYNLDGGSPGTRYSGPISEETRVRLSDAHKGKIRSTDSLQKLSATLTGHPTSPETRQKISIAQKGKKRHSLSSEWRTKISVANKGKVHSQEHRQKLSIAQHASPKCQNHMAELHVARIGILLPLEWRQNLSVAHRYSQRNQEHLVELSTSNKGQIPWNKGKPPTAEHRANLKKAWIKRKENQGIV